MVEGARFLNEGFCFVSFVRSGLAFRGLRFDAGLDKSHSVSHCVGGPTLVDVFY